MPTVKKPKYEPADAAEKYLTKEQVKKRYHLKSGRAIQMWVAEGRFPKPLRLSYRVAVWAISDLDKHDAAIRAGKKPKYK